MLKRLTDLQRGKREGSYFGTVLRQNVRNARKNMKANFADIKKATIKVGLGLRSATARTPQVIVGRASAQLGRRIRRNR